jgi:S1-C subfamily serine protease
MRPNRMKRYSLVFCTAVSLCFAPTWAAEVARIPPLGPTIESVQPRMVKLYGAGGFRGLEAYQSGFLISAEGHVLTAWSYVLDTDHVTVVLNDGRQFKGELLGADPRLEVAVLKIEAADLPHFDLEAAAVAEPGTRVLAFSNLFGVATGDEPASVLHGTISARTELAARRGVYQTPYRGPAYVMDAMTNNPGAAGGALVTARGELLGMLGKELKNSLSNTWLNYAIPIAELKEAVDGIRAGNYVARPADATEPKAEDPLDLFGVGIVLVPDVLDRTPPFIDEVRPGSAAHEGGLRPDDLVLFVGDRLVQSTEALRAELAYLERDEPLSLTVMRDNELIQVTLQAAPSTSPPPEQ